MIDLSKIDLAKTYYADEIGKVIMELEGLKKDMKMMEVKIEKIRTAVTHSQTFLDRVKSEMGLGEKGVTKDVIFTELFCMDVEKLKQLKKEVEQACSEESMILSRLKEMSVQSLLLQEKYL